MHIYFIGIVIFEFILLVIFKKLRKYTAVMFIVDITTVIFYYLLMNVPFIKEHSIYLVDQLIVLILSLSIALLIDTIFVAFIQKLSEQKIIHQCEKKYQSNTFEYYRDILEEKSPAILSLCYNAKKMNFKDIVVSILLYLKQINVIEFKNDDIRIIGDISKLKEHEKIVLEYMENKYRIKKFKRNFFRVLLEDTEKKNYIFKEKEEKANMTIFAQMVIIIMIIFILLILFLLPSIAPILEVLEISSELGPLIFLAYFLFFVGIPIYQWIENRINLIVRTDKGFELCGKLKGLKNFLKDFSKLSNSELKQMELYDEYVIYGVILNLKRKVNRESNLLYKKIIDFPKKNINVKIKKRNYEKEVINTKILMPLLFIAFIWIIFAISMIIEQAYAAVFALLIPFILIVILGIIKLVLKQKFKRRRNVILNYGIKLPGNIIERKTDNNDHYVIVRYEKDGRMYEYNTPNLNFSISKIKGNDVDVYYFKGYCYVDNFKIK